MLPAGTRMGILRYCGRTLVRRPHFQATRSAGARIAYMCRGTWLRWSAVGADTAVAMVTPRITRHNWPQPVPVPVPRQRRRRRSFGIRAAAAPGSASQAGGRSVPLCPGRARAGSPPPCSPCTVTATRVRDARVCWRACLHEGNPAPITTDYKTRRWGRRGVLVRDVQVRPQTKRRRQYEHQQHYIARVLR